MSHLNAVRLSLVEIERHVEMLAAVVRDLPETDLWKVPPGCSNSVGTLARHLAGNLNHFLGAEVLRNGYVRDRPREFSERDVPKAQILSGLRDAVEVARAAMASVTEDFAASPHTAQPSGETFASWSYFALRLATHAAYHAGQASIVRRAVG